MSNIFDKYTAEELRTIFYQNKWPDDFQNWINNRIASDLLDSWLENVDDITYKERARDIIENETYGYKTDNDQMMLEFTLENH